MVGGSGLLRHDQQGCWGRKRLRNAGLPCCLGFGFRLRIVLFSCACDVDHVSAKKYHIKNRPQEFQAKWDMSQRCGFIIGLMVVRITQNYIRLNYRRFWSFKMLWTYFQLLFLYGYTILLRKLFHWQKMVSFAVTCPYITHIATAVFLQLSCLYLDAECFFCL